MKLIATGAEAAIYAKGSTIVKQRQPKAYRAKELDDRLRLFRVRRETKVMEALQNAGINAPKVLDMDEKSATITMELIEGKKVKDTLSNSNCRGICREIGNMIGRMHSQGIIHGDLTTSNMIKAKNGLYFIDFGLSMFSNREEDKAVDLHLFRQAMESSHHKIAQECFEAAITAYKKANSGWGKVLARLEEVEERGRNKHKG